MFKVLFNTIKMVKPTYKASKNAQGIMPGTRAVGQMFIKNIGVLPSVFTAIGALGGKVGAPIIPGSGIVGAAGGYALGFGLQKGGKFILKGIKKSAKLANKAIDMLA